MFKLRTLGKEFHAVATDRNRPLARPFTEDEENNLIEELMFLVDVSDIEFITVDESPYDSVEALRLDVLAGKFRTPVLSCGHIVSKETYTLYRALHDIRNHVLQNKSFSPFDELLSAFDLVMNLQGKVSAYTLDFIFTDVLLMNSVYAHSPKKWNALQNGVNHRICCLNTWQSSKLLVDSKA